MNDFSTQWLALREPYDQRARSAALERQLIEALAARREIPLTVIDLGGGTGANLRHLAPRLAGAQHWRIVENDATLLEAVPDAMAAWARRAGHGFREAAGGWQVDGMNFSARISLDRCDLAQAVPELALHGAFMVTASALLDLVSSAWLDVLLRRCAAVRACVLFAMSYDGAIAWTPAHADDAIVRDAFNAHQRRDKGFGAALGPCATAMARRSLASLGYEVAVAASDWSIGGGDAEIVRALLSGWSDAAIEARPHARATIQRWREYRVEAIAGERAAVVVGHRDLLGLPPT